MAQDESYQTKVYQRRPTDPDGEGFTIGTDGDLILESGGAMNCTDSATFSCRHDFNFFIRTHGITAEQMMNYMVGRNTFSIMNLSGTTLAVGNVPLDSAPPVLTSRIGYFFFSEAKDAATHQISARLGSAHMGEEVVILLRGANESTVLTIFCDDSILGNVGVIGQSYGSNLATIALLGSNGANGFVRLVSPADGVWAVIDAGESRGDGNEVVETAV